MPELWGNRLLSFVGSHLLVSVLCVQVGFTVAILALLGSGHLVSLDSPALRGLLGAVAGFLILVALYAGWRDRRARHGERSRAEGLSDLMDSVLHPRQEWWWAMDDAGTFTFSSSASLDLLGYAPSELEGQPASIVIDLDDLAQARQSVAAALTPDGSSWSGVVARCRHRDGTPLWMEVSGHARPTIGGASTGFEGACRPLSPQTERVLALERTRKRIEQVLRERTFLTAFQPIHELATGRVIGVEALARFVEDAGGSPERWFSEAATVGLAADLEFAALESALTAATGLPSHLYVALNLSPETCLDPRLPGFLARSGISPDRLVLELTENLAVAAYAPLVAALSPLRMRGLRVAVDDAGAGFASMRHILHLHPDIIKLDRSLIAGIDKDPGQRALGAAMVEFAQRIRAQLIAEGIESEGELAAVTGLGMFAGQGFLLGRPSADPQKWTAWEAVQGRDTA
ncbi:sensor domain-containing phosphodiesterase [Arthrobacter rhizosphaerae]|uniref:sensor domain-containing phosphodiesterase n=1 Tax=Arthrobacter rhizosphaerae TaxID=2855490 RepID=UPI001FF3EC1A|nr:EAL domain-containing protein [Arthrobacter rhizosphaerae]